jgi:hypothetical protein
VFCKREQNSYNTWRQPFHGDGGAVHKDTEIILAIGLRERVAVTTLENIIYSIMDGSFNQDYINELIALETSGKSRADNLNRTIRRMTVNNKLLGIIKEHEADFKAYTRTTANRCVIYVALFCGSYELFYDLISMLGKHFHVQEEVTTELVKSKLCQKYGNGENVSRGICCALGMLVDAGLITRVRSGVYRANNQDKISDFARWIYKKAFLLNNPNYTEADAVETNPFFEFVN